MAETHAPDRPANLYLFGSTPGQKAVLMFTFTHDGETVPTPSRHDLPEAVGSDVRYLPILIAAANEANERGYCPVYDQIAQAIGGPTREQLQDLGLLAPRERDFTVSGTRRVTVELSIPFSITVTAESADDIHDGNIDLDDYLDGTLSGYDIADAIDNRAYYSVEDDNGYEIDYVEED